MRGRKQRRNSKLLDLEHGEQEILIMTANNSRKKDRCHLTPSSSLCSGKAPGYVLRLQAFWLSREAPPSSSSINLPKPTLAQYTRGCVTAVLCLMTMFYGISELTNVLENPYYFPLIF